MIVDDGGGAQVNLLTGIGWPLFAVRADANEQSHDAPYPRGIAPAPAGRVELLRGWPRPQDLQERGRQVRVAGQGSRRGLRRCRRAHRRGTGGPAVPAARGPVQPPAGARLRRRSPGAQAPRRHADAAVGGVRQRQPVGLQVHQLLREVPRVRQGAAALDAPGAHRWREAVRRLRRRHRAGGRRQHRRDHAGADLRGRARGFELHLRLRHAAPDHRGLDRRAGAGAGVHGRRPQAHRARPGPRADQDARSVRPRARPRLRGIRPALRLRRAAGTAGAPARQAQGGSRGAAGAALDPGALAQPALLQPGRAQQGHWPAAGRPEPAAVQEAARLPAQRLRATGRARCCGRCRWPASSSAAGRAPR